jgi:hypothetical protein
MGWIEKLKKLQSGEYKVDIRRPIVENISLPEVEVKADKVTTESGWKKYAIGAAIGAALVYFVFKD